MSDSDVSDVVVFFLDTWLRSEVTREGEKGGMSRDRKILLLTLRSRGKKKHAQERPQREVEAEKIFALGRKWKGPLVL